MKDRQYFIHEFGGCDFLAGSLGELLDLPDAFVDFIRAGDEGDPESLFLGIGELSAEFFGFGIDFNADARLAKLACLGLVGAQVIGAELHQQHRGSGGYAGNQVEFFHGSQQSIQSQ